jgi:hypothetical protein
MPPLFWGGIVKSKTCIFESSLFVSELPFYGEVAEWLKARPC